MWSDVVMVVFPVVGLLPHLVEGPEDVRIEEFAVSFPDFRSTQK